MKILVIGSGGRESALCWKIKQSPKCTELFCSPGNAGTINYAKNISLKDNAEILAFVEKNKIDLTVVGPEQPLVDGIVDMFEAKGHRIFGPSAAAAQIEGSKIFSKDLMKKYGIPTAFYGSFSSSKDAMEYLNDKKFPVVIKADGLAAGKGVIIAASKNEAEKAVKEILDEKQFGDAGASIIIEEYLGGEEASILCFADGKTIVPMESSQDHKRINDKDTGPNTGGMGAYSPAPVVTPGLMKKVQEEILRTSIDAMAKEGCYYKGVLYVGLMITKDGPKVLEYNCRFGDPETQAVLPRLKTDLVEIIESVIDEKLSSVKIEWDKKPSVCVVMASGGYPGEYGKGFAIEGLDDAGKMKDVIVFHAGTSLAGCDTVTSGGRVLGVTALGGSISEAIERAYAATAKISFKDMHFRKDIGYKAL